MTVYARSDVMSVSLSTDHGGCGATHMRPVTHGAPVKVWALDCHPCENHLRSDPKWAPTTSEIPETPDEVRIREDQEKKGEKQLAQNLENSIASLAASQEGMQKLLTLMIANMNPDMAKAMQSMLSPTPVDPVRESHTVATPEPTLANPDRVTVDKIPESATADEAFPDLNKLPVKDLRALAKQQELSDVGTRAELVNRLLVHQVKIGKLTVNGAREQLGLDTFDFPEADVPIGVS